MMNKKNQIAWNAGFELFKDELTTLSLSRRDDLKGHFETCKDKFLLAEQHKNAKEAKSSKPSKPAPGPGKGKGRQGGGSGKIQSGKEKFKGNCSHCGILGHRASDCFKNPASSSYRKTPTYKSEGQSKKRKLGNKMSFDEYKKKKEYEAYVNDLEGGEVKEYDEH